MVQVENAPQSRPHSGLQRADLVDEYLTEGGITRFTVVYFSRSGSDKIGPVRSARLAALRLQKSYGGVLFYSGASDHVLGLIEDGRVPAVDENTQGGHYFVRDPGRPPPHNLYTSQDRLLAGVQQSTQKVDYQLPAHAEPPKGGDAVTKLSFQQTNAHSVAYIYSADSKTYLYASETGPEVDTENGKQPLQITNVILVRVAHHGAGYTEDVLGEQGIDFDLAGQGPAVRAAAALDVRDQELAGVQHDDHEDLVRLAQRGVRHGVAVLDLGVGARDRVVGVGGAMLGHAEAGLVVRARAQVDLAGLDRGELGHP